MTCQLIGGPRDGQVVEVDAHLVMGDAEVYFPHDAHTIEPIAAYRWLFGYPDHLDFAGYADPNADYPARGGS